MYWLFPIVASMSYIIVFLTLKLPIWEGFILSSEKSCKAALTCH